jgi:ADP-ribosyl-[dinitrogen reductase] hydrolase
MLQRWRTEYSMDILDGKEILGRARGCLLGLAAGDALGASLEFSARDSLPFHTEMTGGGPHRLAPGQWTDDTSMALALAESLLARKGLEPRDLMGRFLAWLYKGEYSCTGDCFDIGFTTRAALHRFEATGDPWAGPVSPDTAGNGSLMRLAPAVLFSLGDEARARRLARDQSRVTHGAPQAVEACELFAVILREAVLGAGKSALAPRFWQGDAAIAALAAGTWRGREREEISSSGYVVHTLEAALWCAGRSGSFEEALTLGSADAIPQRWLAPLAGRERIEALADRLCAAG